MDKVSLRQQMLAKRRALEPDQAEVASQQIAAKVLQHTAFKNAHRILFYASKGNEVHTFPLIAQALELGKQISLPKAHESHLSLHPVSSLTELQLGNFGVLEPVQLSEIKLEEIDLIIVPIVAFDSENYRLGYGKGYYDKLLAGSEAYKLGLAYRFQQLAQIPHDPWDVCLDEIITD